MKILKQKAAKWKTQIALSNPKVSSWRTKTAPRGLWGGQGWHHRPGETRSLCGETRDSWDVKTKPFCTRALPAALYNRDMDFWESCQARTSSLWNELFPGSWGDVRGSEIIVGRRVSSMVIGRKCELLGMLARWRTTLAKQTASFGLKGLVCQVARWCGRMFWQHTRLGKHHLRGPIARGAGGQPWTRFKQHLLSTAPRCAQPAAPCLRKPARTQLHDFSAISIFQPEEKLNLLRRCMWHFIHQFFQTEDLSYKQNECMCRFTASECPARETQQNSHYLSNSW